MTTSTVPADTDALRACADCALPIARVDLDANPQALFCRRCESERGRQRARPSSAAS